MARTYVETTWAGADKFAYNGAQQHFKPNGAANPKAYEEKPVEKKAKKVKAPDFRLTSEKTIDRLEKHRADLEAAFESGQLSFDRYDVLLREWQGKMDRAWKRHEKVTGKSFEEQPTSTTPSTKPSIMNAVEDAAKGFAARHPFAFLVASIMVGAGVLNIFGFGG